MAYKEERICLSCKEKFLAPRRKKSDGSYRRSIYCCRICRTNYEKENGKGFYMTNICCANCGDEFRAVYKNTAGEIRKYCSQKCYGVAKRDMVKGENNPRWVGGVVPEVEKRIRTKEWKILSAEIRTRDDNFCQRCGMGGFSFPVHHIVPHRISEDNSPDNLVTLCSECHGWADTHLEESLTFFNPEIG